MQLFDVFNADEGGRTLKINRLLNGINLSISVQGNITLISVHQDLTTKSKVLRRKEPCYRGKRECKTLPKIRLSHETR